MLIIKEEVNMFQYESTVKGKMDIGKVWALYSDVSRWSEWDSDMQNVVLDGAFAVGTTGTMFMKEMPPLPFRLDEVEKEKAFVNTSTLGDVAVRFGHFITSTESGEYTITHTVTITGSNEAQLQGIGHGIVAGIPAGMENLYRLSRTE
jgi:hypothetical protein